jgi:pilus assembly protein Flp/PilA
MKHTTDAAGKVPQAVAGIFEVLREDAMNNLLLKMFVKVQNLMGGLMSREEGQDLVEYALLIALIALAAITGTNKVASAINGVFSKISTTLS